MAGKKLDPFTAEIVRMGMNSICHEMAITMIMTSGSPVLAEAKDFSNSLLSPTGEHYAHAGYVTVHIGSSLLGTQLIIQKFRNTEIKPGDQFMSNDPYLGGACHAADNYVIKPIFYGNSIVCWSYSGGHILDVGGADPGGWSPTAYDMFGEAIHIPPMKIVEAGILNEDICSIIENNVRLPELYTNDLKSFIAANNTAERRLLHLIEDIGLNEFVEYCTFNQALSENMMRSRIRKMPDGVYTTIDWVEHDGHRNQLFRVKCTMTVKDDELELDFSGSDPQGLGGINAAPGGLLGGVWTALVQLLGFDIPFNAGATRPIRIKPGDPGTITNPRRPAATSVGHIDCGAKISKMVTELLSYAFSCSDDPALRGRVSGQFQDCFGANVWSTKTHNGESAILATMDPGGAGGPAQLGSDGLDCAGMMCMVDCALPDVESSEEVYPMLFLWKRLQPNSGGAGTFRGGLGLDYAWILWGAEEAMGSLNAPTYQVPPRGFFGGLPPGTCRFIKISDSNLPQLFAERRYPKQEIVSGRREVQPPKLFPLKLEQFEIFNQWAGGGSGLGDPLLRDPKAVEKDLRDGYITASHATSVYGVVVEASGNLDSRATETVRERIRKGRLAQAKSLGPETHHSAPSDEIRPVFFNLELATHDGTGTIRCARCHTDICDLGRDWRQSAAMGQHELASHMRELDVSVEERPSEPLLLVEYFCPSCGTELDCTVGRKGEEDPRNILPNFLKAAASSPGSGTDSD